MVVTNSAKCFVLFIVNSTKSFVKPVVTTVIYLVYNENCVTVTICGPPDAQFYTLLRGPVSLLRGPGPTRGMGNSNTVSYTEDLYAFATTNKKYVGAKHLLCATATVGVSKLGYIHVHQFDIR